MAFANQGTVSELGSMHLPHYSDASKWYRTNYTNMYSTAMPVPSTDGMEYIKRKQEQKRNEIKFGINKTVYVHSNVSLPGLC